MDNRVKTYSRLTPTTGSFSEVEENIPFTHEHFKEMGIPATPAFGMPRSEALELVNRWNSEGVHIFWIK